MEKKAGKTSFRDEKRIKDGARRDNGSLEGEEIVAERGLLKRQIKRMQSRKTKKLDAEEGLIRRENSLAGSR